MNRRGSTRIAAVVASVGVLAGACSSAESPVAEPAATTAPAAAETVVAAGRSRVDEAVATFLDQQSSGNAAAVVAAMVDHGDPEWVPWLVDLLRLGLSSLLSADIGEALAGLTGQPSTGERIGDLIAFGAWSQDNGLTGGPGYREYKTTLYARLDDEFAPLLESVIDQGELAAIQWGGVPRGGIPELNDPGRVPAAEATWMVPDEIVMGVTLGGQSVAYPLRILARHELANDTVGEVPISVVYCTLCRSGLVFDRRVEGRLLGFETSGLLLNSNKIMVDRETDTVWHHLRGLGIGGEFAGVELTRYPVTLLRWADWVAEQPDTAVLTLPEPIFFDDPNRPPIAYDYTPGEAYRSYYENPDVWFPVLDTPDTFPLKSEVVGIAHNGDALALSVAAINETDGIEVEVGGATFSIEPTEPGARVFDADGQPVIVEQSFWFAWFANNLDTRVWPEG